MNDVRYVGFCRERIGKGYPFEVLRAKVLYGTEATIKKPKYTEDMQFKKSDKLWCGCFNTMQPITVYADEPLVLNCGVDLTTLSKILEDGKF